MKNFIFISFLLLSNISSSQDLVQQYDGINFSINGNISPAPFNGGVNNARYQFIDIDADSDLDLFMFDADTSLYFYENTGTNQNASFKLASTRFQNLYFKNWFYFADMDSDNDYDLFTGGDLQTVKYFKNTGSSSNAFFSLMIEELHSSGDTVIYSESNCVPVFCDIDGDGDKDFFTGQSLGTIVFYENIDNAGNFSFKFITDFWQNLLIISPAASIRPELDNRHGSNSLEFFDIDNDNDYDLFWGDLFSKGIYFIKNNGTSQVPNVIITDSIYPPNSPYISQGYNSVRFADIDADGDKDMFVSVLYLSQNRNNFAFYRNTGTSSNANFQRASEDYLSNADVGGNSNIVFTDIDNDGDKDLFIGSDFSRLSLYKNTGSASIPSFELTIDSLPILSVSFNYAPAFADMDNDGDQDLLLGSYIKDSVWFYRNTGNANSFIFTLEARGHQIGLTTLGQSSTPTFIDIDGDDDKDLFLGATNGRIFFYENTGTAENFNFVFRSNFYNSIDAGDESIPRFFDIDSDADYDLFIGRQDGKISYYKNDGNASNANFIFQTNEYKNISAHQNACPEFTDIDNDTDLDLFLGNIKGGLYYFRNDDVIGIQNTSTVIQTEYKLYQNYPNPFNPSTKIKFDLPQNSLVRLSVFDMSGREIALLADQKLNPGSYEYTWNAEGLSSGVYFYKLTTDNYSENKKMLFIK